MREIIPFAIGRGRPAFTGGAAQPSGKVRYDMKINIAANKRLIPQERAAKAASRRARRMGVPEGVQPRVELGYKKLYFCKILALAARTPFPPKKIDYTLFYDPVMNQGGLTESVPAAQAQEVDEQLILPEKYTLETFEAQKKDFVEKYILRAYLLKRPELQDRGIEEVYLPYWVCTFSSKVEILVNAATGRVNI